MPETTIHELYLAYRSSGKGRERIMEQVARLVYCEHQRFGFDDADAAADAFYKHRARIERLIDKFEYKGLPFDAYLATSLRYLARSARRERKRQRDRELVCERGLLADDEGARCLEDEALDLLQAEEMQRVETGSALSAARDGSEPAAPRGAEGREAGWSAAAAPWTEGVGRSSNRRPRARGGLVKPRRAEKAAYSSRLIFLALKCAWEIDEEGVGRVAQSAGVERAWLSAAIEQARRSLECEAGRIRALAERRNLSWSRLRLLETRLAAEPEPSHRRELEAALNRERTRSRRAEEELALRRPIVPNSVVARILGVPKGTVDSGLYYLRRSFERRG